MLNRVTTFEGGLHSSFLTACLADQAATRERKPSTSMRSSSAAASTACEAFGALSVDRHPHAQIAEMQFSDKDECEDRHHHHCDEG
jgi:hypothetical protein